MSTCTATKETLLKRLAMPLEGKIALSKVMAREFYEAMNGNVYVAFSGGKDSSVLLDILRSMYPELPGVFSNTGLEYLEIVRHVKRHDNITIIRPERTHKWVFENEGFPIISKIVAKQLRELQNPKESNSNVRNLYLNGVTSDGRKCKRFKLPDKWRFLIDAPFKISERCCDILKKAPFKRFENKTGLKPFVGTMATDSRNRMIQYLNTGCNSLNGHAMSKPLSFWTEEDIWNYIRMSDLEYSQIYDMGEQRTGCIFCMFGIHLENFPNRFQRMEKHHPKQWNYCMNKLGCSKLLDYIGIEYKNTQKTITDF